MPKVANLSTIQFRGLRFVDKSYFTSARAQDRKYFRIPQDEIAAAYRISERWKAEIEASPPGPGRTFFREKFAEDGPTKERTIPIWEEVV